ncbi:dnaaf1, partial [Symbiodinium sp. KB8]
EANNSQSVDDPPQKDVTKEVSEDTKPGPHDALAGFLSSLFGGAQSSGAAPFGSSEMNDPAPQVDHEETADDLAEPSQKHRQTSNSEAGEEILGMPPLVPKLLESAEESWHEAPGREPEVAHWEAAQDEEARKPEAEEDAEELMAFHPLHAASTAEQQADDDPAESLPPLPSLAWSGRVQLAPAEADAAETQSEASASRSEMLVATSAAPVAAAPRSQGVAAPSSKRSPDPGAARCKVADLRDWLEELRLDEYLDAATTWCAEMGAVSLEEIAENIEEFGVDVSLKPIERQRVQKWASQRLPGRGSVRQLADARGGSQGGPGRWEEPPLALARRELQQLPQWPEAQGRQARGFLPAPDSSSALAVPERDAPDETPIYTARSVRLAVDSMGNTGLDLRFDDDWGILVQSVDPLPGQPGLAEGDFIVAIEGCSLRHRSHEECDAVFSERLQRPGFYSSDDLSWLGSAVTVMSIGMAKGFSKQVGTRVPCPPAGACLANPIFATRAGVADGVVVGEGDTSEASPRDFVGQTFAHNHSQALDPLLLEPGRHALSSQNAVVTRHGQIDVSVPARRVPMTVAQAEAVLAPAEAQMSHEVRQSNADRSHSAIDFCHFVLQAKDDAKDDSKDERYAGIVRRMTPELIQECCKERQMWPQAELCVENVYIIQSQPQLNTVLYLNYKGFETIEGLEAYTNLRALHLGNNNIAKIEGLDRMSSLRSLNLDGNRIMCIENLKGNLELRQLSIESNALRQLSNLSHLTKLEQLNVSRNAITKVTDLEELKSVPSLENIDISHNCIEESDGVVEFWASLPGELKILRFHSNPGLRFIEHYRKRMVNAVPSLRYLDERPIFPVERKASAAWAEGGIQAMQQAKREFLQEQNRQQNSVDPDRREFLTQQRKLALARIEREEQEKREQAEKEEEEALRQTPVQKGDPQALDAYVKDWKAKVERFGPEVVREQAHSCRNVQLKAGFHLGLAPLQSLAELRARTLQGRNLTDRISQVMWDIGKVAGTAPPQIANGEGMVDDTKPPWHYDLEDGDAIPVGDRLIRVTDICFTQKDVNDSFSDSRRPIMELISDLLEGRKHPREVPRIRVAFAGGSFGKFFYSADNRRLFAFKHCNIDWAPVRVLRWEKQHEFEMKAKNGEAVRAEGGGHLAGMVQRLADQPLPRSPVMLEARTKISLYMDDETQRLHDELRQAAKRRFLKESQNREYLADCIGKQWMFVVQIQDQMMPATLVKATPDGTFEACIWNGEDTVFHPCLLPSSIWLNSEVPVPRQLSVQDLACSSFIVPSDLNAKLPNPWCAICSKRVGSSSKDVKRHERGHPGAFRFSPKDTYFCRIGAEADSSDDSQEPGPTSASSHGEPLPGTFVVPKQSRSGTAHAHPFCLMCREALPGPKQMRQHEKASHPGHYRCSRCQKTFDCTQAEPKKQMFAPPPRTAASRVAPNSSTAADFKQQSGTVDDHADRQFAVLDATESEDLPATHREVTAKKGLNLADLGANVVPDLWKDLEEKNKEAELAVDAANAAASEAYRDEKKKAAASGADSELQGLHQLPMAWFGSDAVDSAPEPGQLVCVACSASPTSLRCSRCKAPYCSVPCQRQHWPQHKQSCTTTTAGIGVAPTPSAHDLRRELRPFAAKGWQDYLGELGASSKEQVERVKHRQCFGVATLEALQSLPSSARLEPVNGRCVMWVLGARDGIEKRQIVQGGWQRLFECLEVGWDVVLVGPEMSEDKAVLTHSGIRVYTFACLAHEAVMPQHLRRPTFVCAFNSGLGASVPVHMKPWIQTLVQLLAMGRPLLLTCFGSYEARLEASVLNALQAQYMPHKHGGFGHVLEADKPLSICNALFTWVLGSSIPEPLLLTDVKSYVEKQLEASQLLLFLKELRSHIRILQDPDGSAHAGWAEMYDGRFIPAIKQALEEDDDDRGGIQQIVRCTMKTIASACAVTAAARLFLYLSGLELLRGFKRWAESAPWTSHAWIREETLEWEGDEASSNKDPADSSDQIERLEKKLADIAAIEERLRQGATEQRFLPGVVIGVSVFWAGMGTEEGLEDARGCAGEQAASNMRGRSGTRAKWAGVHIGELGPAGYKFFWSEKFGCSARVDPSAVVVHLTGEAQAGGAKAELFALMEYDLELETGTLSRGVVSITGSAKSAGSTPSEDISNPDVVFDCCDTDSSGELDMHELKFALNAFGLFPSLDYLRDWMGHRSSVDRKAFHNLLDQKKRSAPTSMRRPRTIPYARRGVRMQQLDDLQHAFISSGWLKSKCDMFNEENMTAIAKGTDFAMDTNLYALNRWVIMPGTSPSAVESLSPDLRRSAGMPVPTHESSYSELMNSAGLPVDYFVSHFWGHPFQDTWSSLSLWSSQVHWQIGKEPENMVYWVCLLALNQHQPGEEVGGSPEEGPFNAALVQSACGAVMVVDEDVSPFSRIWCLFEVKRLTDLKKDFHLISSCGAMGSNLQMVAEDEKRQALLDFTRRVADALSQVSAFKARSSSEEDKFAIWHRVADPHMRRMPLAIARERKLFNPNTFKRFDTTIRSLLAAPLFQTSLQEEDAASALRYIGLGAPFGEAELQRLSEEWKVDVCQEQVQVQSGTRMVPWHLLHCAAYFGHADSVASLVRRKAKLEVKTTFGLTPLHQAARNGHAHVCEMLLDLKANINAVTRDSRSATQNAAHQGHREVVELLAARRADINHKDQNGITALHSSSVAGYDDIVKVG